MRRLYIFLHPFSNKVIYLLQEGSMRTQRTCGLDRCTIYMVVY